MGVAAEVLVGGCCHVAVGVQRHHPLDVHRRRGVLQRVADGQQPGLGGGLAGQSDADWDWLQTMIVGTLRNTTRAFLPAVAASPAGRFAIVSQTGVAKPTAGNANYLAAKAAAETWLLAVGDALKDTPASVHIERVMALYSDRDVAASPDKDFGRHGGQERPGGVAQGADDHGLQPVPVRVALARQPAAAAPAAHQVDHAVHRAEPVGQRLHGGEVAQVALVGSDLDHLMAALPQRGRRGVPGRAAGAGDDDPHQASVPVMPEVEAMTSRIFFSNAS